MIHWTSGQSIKRNAFYCLKKIKKAAYFLKEFYLEIVTRKVFWTASVRKKQYSPYFTDTFPNNGISVKYCNIMCVSGIQNPFTKVRTAQHPRSTDKGQHCSFTKIAFLEAALYFCDKNKELLLRRMSTWIRYRCMTTWWTLVDIEC